MAFNLFAPQKPQPTGFTSMDQSRWAQLGNEQKAATEKWVNDTKQNLGIGQNTNPEPIVTPFTPGTKVVQQPVVQEQKTTPVQNTQNTQVQQPITSTEDLARALGYTSPEEEEKMRKASVANQRIMAVADALRQIGNIYNTTRYAPSQQFNSPVELERQRYLQGKALRDKANQTYISYQQAKAAQDAKQRQWEAEFGLKTASAASQDAYRKEQARLAAEKAANQKAYQESLVKLRDKLGTAQNEERARHNKVVEGQGNRRIGIQAQNAKNMQAYRQWKMNNGGGSGGRGGTLTFRGANGFLSKKMSAQEANAFYNQAFDELSKMRGANGKPIIDQNAVAGNMLPGILGGNKINMQARKEAVDKAIYQHPEAGRFLQDKFEFELDPRGAQQTAMPTTQSSGIKLGRDFWNSQLQQGGYGSTYTPDAAVDDDWDEYAEGMEDEWEEYAD